MAVALAAASGERHELIENHLVVVADKKPRIERNSEQTKGKRLRLRRGRGR